MDKKDSQGGRDTHLVLGLETCNSLLTHYICKDKFLLSLNHNPFSIEIDPLHIYSFMSVNC
jgi:hypothetical protein